MSVILPVLSRALAVRSLRLANEDLTRRVQERTLELEAANQELDAFCHSVSHDLRAPLRAVNWYASVLLKKFSAQIPEEGKGVVESITGSARRMEELIDGLLQFSRLGRQTLSRRPTQVAALVHEVLMELRGGNTHPVEIHAANLPDCVADPLLLRQVFSNLLSNALKFSRQRTPAVIEIGATPGETETVYFVRDNGTGFEMEYSHKSYNVFQRLHRYEDYEGAGVGLSIVQRIVQRHGGRVWAESAVDQGATFFLSIPN